MRQKDMRQDLLRRLHLEVMSRFSLNDKLLERTEDIPG